MPDTNSTSNRATTMDYRVLCVHLARSVNASRGDNHNANSSLLRSTCHCCYRYCWNHSLKQQAQILNTIGGCTSEREIVNRQPEGHMVKKGGLLVERSVSRTVPVHKSVGKHLI
jgi:hypothetical protein